METGFSSWKEFSKRALRLLLVGLFVVGGSEVLIGLDRAHRDPIVAAYLVKSGAEYLVVWRGKSDSEFRAYRFESLAGARRHLAKLDLIPTAASAPLNRLERLGFELWTRRHRFLENPAHSLYPSAHLPEPRRSPIFFLGF